MAVMTEAKLRKIVREELKRRLRESYDPFYDTEMGDEREWVEDTEEDLSGVKWFRMSGGGKLRSRTRWRPTEQGWRSEEGDELISYSEMPAPRMARLREAAYRATLRRLRHNH